VTKYTIWAILTIASVLTISAVYATVQPYDEPYQLIDQAGAGTVRLHIEGGGNVGIGTTSPTHPLTLQHTDDNSPAFTIISASDLDRRLYQQYDGASNIAIIRAADEGFGPTSIALNPFGGNVGVGTLGPTHPLTLRHVDDNSPAFTIISASDNNRRLYQQYDGINNVAIIRGAEEGVGATNIALNPFGGNVGVGTSAPSNKLDVIGNVEVTGDFVYSSAKTRNFVIGSQEFNANEPISYSGNSGEGAFFTSGTNPIMFGGIHIPAGSTITQMDCRVVDNHATRNVNCNLLSYLNGASVAFEAGSVSTGQSSLVQIISTGAISVTTLSNRNYIVNFNPTNVDCDSDCRFFQAIITYEVSTAD